MKNKIKASAVLALAGAFLPVVASAAVVPMSAESAFQKASTVLVGMDAMPTFRDKELLVIKTDPVQVKLTPDQADCGKMFGIPYLKDKRTKTAATYQVVIKPIDGTSSDVSIKVALDGYMDVNEGAPFFIEKTRDKNKGAHMLVQGLAGGSVHRTASGTMTHGPNNSFKPKPLRGSA